tara:strand:+ start:574 stop:705 length:132 start_codon:yes stop_codon:yes gene_type:complete
MIKNLILFFMVIFILSSCGKKGDPFYVDPEKKSKNYSHNINFV